MSWPKPLVEFLASVAYVGKIPFAPGTWGTLVALPVIYFVPQNALGIIFVVATLLGLALCTPVTRLWQVRDPGWFVLDEFCGMMLTMLFLPPRPELLLTGFILFRIFDIAKPLGIRRLDRMPHPTGILWDDLLAGLYANLLLQAFQTL